MNTRDYQQNLNIAITLHETGKAMAYQKIVRDHPGASASRIDSVWQDWLYRKKDVIPGDLSGPVRIRKAS